jgi:hypothetical protein
MAVFAQIQITILTIANSLHLGYRITFLIMEAKLIGLTQQKAIIEIQEATLVKKA